MESHRSGPPVLEGSGGVWRGCWFVWLKDDPPVERSTPPHTSALLFQLPDAMRGELLAPVVPSSSRGAPTRTKSYGPPCRPGCVPLPEPSDGRCSVPLVGAVRDEPLGRHEPCGVWEASRLGILIDGDSKQGELHEHRINRIRIELSRLRRTGERAGGLLCALRSGAKPWRSAPWRSSGSSA